MDKTGHIRLFRDFLDPTRPVEGFIIITIIQNYWTKVPRNNKK
jgi:hypothetical protein